jgi:glycosyltransferase involved in cell wall biosynthesis
MRIAINVCRIGDFGVGTYIRNLVRTLAVRDRANRYILLGDEAKVAQETALPDNFEVVRWCDANETWWSHMRLHRLLQAFGVNLLHIPHLAVAPMVPCRYLMTVHDVGEFLYGPRQGFRQTLRFRMTQRSLAKASRLMAVSHATKQDIENLFTISPDKITVVENAIDERFVRPGRREEGRLMLERYQVKDPFLLYVGSARPQKNIPRLIEAFAVIRGELREHAQFHKLKLLIIGDELSENPLLRQTVVRTRMQEHVRFMGYLPAESLRVFYQAAEVFVFPSLYEGFGLPPLEAMAQGTPVVTSNVSSLPEVVGDAAVLVHPENVFDIAKGVQQVLLDPELRQELRERGKRQLARFSWERSILQVMDIYSDIAGEAAAA